MRTPRLRMVLVLLGVVIAVAAVATLPTRFRMYLNRRHVRMLYAGLRSENPHVRANALLLLVNPSSGRPHAGVELAVRALRSDPSAYVRSRATITLEGRLIRSTVGQKEFWTGCVALARAAAQDSVPDVRFTASDALVNVVFRAKDRTPAFFEDNATALLRPYLAVTLRDADIRVRGNAEGTLSLLDEH